MLAGVGKALALDCVLHRIQVGVRGMLTSIFMCVWGGGGGVCMLASMNI